VFQRRVVVCVQHDSLYFPLQLLGGYGESGWIATDNDQPGTLRTRVDGCFLSSYQNKVSAISFLLRVLLALFE
jgi:hypothetical protein